MSDLVQGNVVKLISLVVTVGAVEKRSIAKSVRKLADGTPLIDREDLGWFVVLKECGIAIGVGSEEPELKPGQRVRMTLEPV